MPPLGDFKIQKQANPSKFQRLMAMLTLEYAIKCNGGKFLVVRAAAIGFSFEYPKEF